MSKIFLSIGLVVLLAGCADFERLATPDPSTPSFASLRSGAKALVCGVSTAAALAGRIEDAVGAGEAAVGTTGQIYVVSALVCGALGGVVTGASTIK